MVSQPKPERQLSNQDSIDDLNLSQEEDNGDEPYEKYGVAEFRYD
ncbi:hypothetical protein QUA81_08120 [Microcoleus sp. F6_B4]